MTAPTHSSPMRFIRARFARWAAALAVSLLSASPTLAAENQCMGLAADGKAVCTAPLLRGYTYQLCSSSSLYVEQGLRDRCTAQVVGGYGIPITSPGTLQALINCMGGQGSPSWMSSGSGNGFYCGGSVSYKYGSEVTGVSLEIPYGYGNLQPKRGKTAVCPYGYSPVGPTDLPDYCIKATKCPCDAVGNPMGVANGDHSRIETDITPSAASPLEFSRHYVSSAYYRPAQAANSASANTPAILDLNFAYNLIPGFGDYWRHTYDRRVLAETSTYLLATVIRPNGVNKHFRPDGTLVINEDGRADRLQQIAGGWLYFTDNEVETYSSDGVLQSIKTRGGRSITLTYSAAAPGVVAGLLTTVTDDSGRTLQFAYDSKLRIASITDSDNKVIQYGYSGDLMLGSVTYPGGASRSYLYNENPLGRQGGEFGLTGVIDEFGNRQATYGYGGNAYTEYIGGTNRHERSVQSASQVTITDPLGTARVYTLQSTAGATRVAGVSQPAGSGSAAASSTRTFDSAGNLASSDDFDGRRSCMASDPTRLLETTRVEGLANTVACATVTGAGASLPAGSRKISTQWHPDWRMPTRRAEPKRLATFVYNGQPDPTAGGAIASCAPAAAVLPDNKPIAVLCAKVEQATTDADGSQGLSAALDASVAARRWSYTYNARGQVLNATDPRNNTTTYTYYATTTATATQGDLQSVTNAAGHTTTYDSYDRNGLVLQMTDPNGMLTTTGYDNRRRPQTITVAAGAVTQTTSYEYDADGKVHRVVLPDGTDIVNTYDLARRLVGVKDPAGNTVTYTLDNAGNRIAEQVKDPGGTLARSVQRAFDALNRVYSVTGAPQ
jgi:YD repeat-containing protein